MLLLILQSSNSDYLVHRKNKVKKKLFLLKAQKEINPAQCSIPIPPKKSEKNLPFSNIFRGYVNGTLI